MDKAFSVSQVNRYIKGLLEDDALLCELKVEGEISNFKHHTSGHMYFTLKDATASINCVMFASYGLGLKFEPKNGTKVIVSGNISLYEKTGQYQLYAVYMKPVGEGDLAAAFIKLRDTLKAQGLFDDARKKQIPEDATCVALVTSPTGAAVQDMIKVIRSLNPSVKIVVVPVLVQGENAAEDIARGIQEVNEWDKISTQAIDVMIIGRGGGSMEDLWAFNEEVVARAIEASKVPIISAVGHETDFTIADFVADLRAPTPSVAAATAVPDISAQYLRTKELKNKLDTSLNRIVNAAKTRLLMSTQLLEKLSPYALWERGYAMLSSAQGNVQSVQDLAVGDSVTIHMLDGDAITEVLKISEENRRR